MSSSSALILSVSAKPAVAETAVVFLSRVDRLPEVLKKLDTDAGGAITRQLAAGAFKAKWGQVKSIALPKKAGYTQVLLVGAKPEKDLKLADLPVLGGKIYAALGSLKTKTALVLAPDKEMFDPVAIAEVVGLLGEGLDLSSYRFDLYRSKKDEDSAPVLKSVTFEVADAATAKAAEKVLVARRGVVAGTAFARDLGNEPPNVLYPESFAKRIKDELAPLGVKVEVFDDKQLLKMKMGGICGVGQGAGHPPRMVVLRWNGAGTATGDKKRAGKKAAGPVAFVGKGITFDSGGISIKPSAGMEDMKFDMGGAAAVVGAMKAIAASKLKIDVVGAVGLAENIPSHTAYRPSDIITAYNGKTVEVLNTDAEGRLVLMDVISYVQKTDKPRMLIDLATLTGAICVALGASFAGAFATDDTLWGQLDRAAGKTGERLWRMPLDADYRKEMEGGITDLRNIGGSREAGACTAAGFLQHFIDGELPWAHLDIAGTAWGKGGALGPKGATGFGVRLLHDFAADLAG